MIRRIALLAALLSGPALAQQGTTLQTQPVPATPYQTVPQVQPQQNQGIRETHGDWEIRCLTATDCVMTQLSRRSEQTADAVFTIIKPKGLRGEDGLPIEAFAEIVVPLGVYLPGGLGLKVDQNPAKAAPYERCIEEGCVVRAPISPEMLASLKAGSVASIVIFGGPEKPVRVPMSLIGFTAAFDAF